MNQPGEVHLQHRQRMQADMTLLAVSLIWGTAFVVQRIASAQIGVFLFSGVRFLIGAAALVPLVAFNGLSAPVANNRARQPGITVKVLPGVMLLGVLLAGGAAFQQAGLTYTTAGNAGFITGLYVVLVPLFQALVWRQWPRTVTWAAALLAAMGLFLLSTGGQIRLQRGDGLVLVGTFFWSVHVLLLGRLVQKVDVVQLSIGQYLICGTIGLSISMALEPGTWKALVNSWWMVAYTSVLSVSLGYTLQAVGQRVAPPADAAIILSLEAVIAALSGWLFLDEVLSAVQLFGCVIMLTGMLLAQSEVLLGRARAGAYGDKPT